MDTDLGLELNLRRFTVDEYFENGPGWHIARGRAHRAIDGRIVVKRSQGPQHLGGVALAMQTLACLLATHYLMPNGTVRLTKWSAPEPDFALVAKTGGGLAAARHRRFVR